MSAGDRRKGRTAGRAPTVAMLVAIMLTILWVDLAVPSLGALPLLLVPLLLGSMRLTPRGTAGLAVLAFSIVTVSGIAEDGLQHPDEWLWLVAMSLVGVLSVALSDTCQRERAGWEAAEHQRTLADARYRLISRNSSDVILLADSAIRTKWASPSASRTLGWAADELQGRAVEDFIHADDVTAFRDMASDIVSATEAVRVRSRWRRPDGRYRWMETVARPIEDESTDPVSLLEIRDVDAEVQASSALSENRARYQLLAENASDVVYAAGFDQLITWISPAITKVLGWAPGELVGTKMAELIHPDDRDATRAAREQIYLGVEVESPAGGFLVRTRTATDGYRWMAIKLTRLEDEHGALAGIIGAMTLVEELVEARARAEAKEQRQRALVDSMLDPFVLMTAVRDAQGQIVDFVFEDANPAALAAYHRTRDELVGHRLEEIQPQAGQTDLYAMYLECIEHGRPIILDDWSDPKAHGSERAPRYDVRGVKVGDSVSETWRNVTERNQAIERIVESEERFRLLAQSSSGIVMQARDGIINWVSPSLTQELGWSTADWIGRRFEDFIHEDDTAAAQEAKRAIETGATRVTRFRIRASLGAYHWIEMHAGPFINARGEQDGLVGSFRIIDSEVEAQERLERQARFDDLTGALKRDLALARLNDAARSPRNPGNETGVLFIDLDDFKIVNDTWGHVAGDTVLKAMSDRIRAAIRAADTVARIGGDEFLVLLDGMHDLSEVLAVAEKIRARCAEPVATSGGAVAITISIGVTVTHPVETGDAIIARADRAMYEAKKRGRNLVIPIDVIE